MSDRGYKERVLEEDYPVYPGYFYVADDVVICSPIEGTVAQLKKELRASEIKSCDAIGRGLL